MIGKVIQGVKAKTNEMIGKVIQGVKAKTGENGDLPPKIGRNRRSVTNSPTMSVFKILQTVPIDQNKPIMN
jgi:hypothetical protein